MTRFFNNFIVFLVALLFVLGVVSPSLAAKEIKRVLILYNQESGHPATKHIALVAGTTPNDAYGEQIFRQGLKPYAGTLALIDLTKLSMEETLSRVRAIPPDTLVLYSGIIRDGAGKYFVPHEALSLIAPAANAPVFSLYETYLGYGIVGGRLVSLEQHGREAAALALRILSGESPGGIPFGGEQAYVSIYDWRELKRWGIPESAVPAGGVILYRQSSLWEEHWNGIIAVIFLILIEGLLILGFMINLRMRRKAERSLRESETRMTMAAGAAGLGVWIRTIATNRVWGSEQALRLFGFEPGADISSEMVIQRIHPDDREGKDSAVRHAMETGAGYAERIPRHLAGRHRALDRSPGSNVCGPGWETGADAGRGG